MGRKTILVILAILIVSIPIFPLSARQGPTVITADSNANLTGRIFDYGKDTDGDGLFNSLVVDVEVNVDVGGTYRVGIDELRDDYEKSLYFESRNEIHLDPGLHNVTLSFDGIVIHGSKLNVNYARYVGLYYKTGSSEFTATLFEMPLSKTYDYSSFDGGATLTGLIHDMGKDTDGNGFFNFLEVEAEVNVTDEAEYQLSVFGLNSVSGYSEMFIPVFNASRAFLPKGTQNLAVTLFGPTIRASHAANISEAAYVTLEICLGDKRFTVDSQGPLPLTKTYSYQEFESQAYLTGTVFDVGVDTDGNSKYDYLEIRIQVNVTQAGYYTLLMQNLVDNASQTIFVYQDVSGYFDVGLHLVNLTIYGPRIYLSHASPVQIGTINMFSSDLLLDSLSNVPLTTIYAYTDFDSHALFPTPGATYDRGVDTDGDGLFDYLEVGIGINVTKPGTYGISVYGLERKSDGWTDWLYASQTVEKYFGIGLHTVCLNYSGPMIAQAHFDVEGISGLTLYEAQPSYFQLDYVSSNPLSRRYGYTLFDAPLRETQVNFTVYPDGTVGLGGTFNYTHMYPANTGPLVNASIDFSTVANSTAISINGTAVIPPSLAPLNSTSGYLIGQYSNNVLNATMEATVTMPPKTGKEWPMNTSDFSFNSTYSNQMLNVDLTAETTMPSIYTFAFPFNISDITVLADYKDNDLTGNITFHTISGFPLGDVTADLRGNKTDLCLTGNLRVIYGSYFGTEIDSVWLDETLAHFANDIPGQGPNSLYNSTNGLLECTRLDTAKTPLIAGSVEFGANVDYNVTLHGNLAGALAHLALQGIYGYSLQQAYPAASAAVDSAISSVQKASITLVYYHTSGIASIDLHLTADADVFWSNALELIPATVPSENRTMAKAWLQIANATAHAYKDVSLNASYSSADQKLSLRGQLLADTTGLENATLQNLTDAFPPQLRGIVESYVNAEHYQSESSNFTFNCSNGVANFAIHENYEGDFKAQLNYSKRFFIDCWNVMSPSMTGYPLQLLNETDFDINNLKAEFRIDEDSAYLTFDGVILHPVKEEAEPTMFNLREFFSAVAESIEPPSEFQKSRMTITGAGNATHTVLLHASSTGPYPDATSPDYSVMTWNNVTMSSLRDLDFLVAYEGTVNHLGKEYYVPIFTNSTVSNFNFDAAARRVSFNVEGAGGTGFFNVTIPRSLLYAELDGWTVRIDGAPVPSDSFTVTENQAYVFLYLKYSHSSHLIEIEGTWVVAEFQLSPFLAALLILSLAGALIAVSCRKKFGGPKPR